MIFSIARFCFSRKVVCRIWRIFVGMGYVIRGRFVSAVWSLMTILLGFNWNWTG